MVSQMKYQCWHNGCLQQQLQRNNPPDHTSDMNSDDSSVQDSVATVNLTEVAQVWG